ncbi:YceD family protein [Legionella cardiaca]|uniref:Large ribosomal RNA subunit accumulation protein YceD n=1 Tax=Legionella cardiaca TaxID=1071983 RepID=A0ABY8AYM8_9GAMM|nr:YceD family protein [Legionella cardiaca]WED44212.1 YceD family protein [Legionella cardiaca]
MLINLKSMAASAEPGHVKLELLERLPIHVKSPCVVNCKYTVEKLNNYYLLNLVVDSTLTIICQRCLKEFNYQYINTTALAVCYSDEMAEKLMEQYECIIAKDNQVDLNELVTDELHLYSPEAHPEITYCDSEINRFIVADNTIKS